MLSQFVQNSPVDSLVVYSLVAKFPRCDTKFINVMQCVYLNKVLV